uniref:G_PROTEIN_RECEP_F1_2 domain-containing protein n=1 Tax=Heterorhabditis bacteriophora TaxID=37862 RepID=A0A1I7WGR9_HETBA
MWQGSQPQWLAKPLYGLAAPIIILITLVTNSFVVVVLSNKNLRTPTNHILLSMAITELMTGKEQEGNFNVYIYVGLHILLSANILEVKYFSGLSSCPWFLYYYTFDGLYVDHEEGLPDFWCKAHPYFAVHLPTMSVININFCSLYLFHTAAIWLTVYLAIQRYIYVCLPSLVVRFCCPKRTKHIIIYICIVAFVSCVLQQSQVIGVDSWKAGLLCTRALFVHILPCALLIIFTACLFKTVNEADRKRSVHQMLSRKQTIGSRCLSSNRRMHATTRMLVVVIGIFLLIEIPVALIFILHLLVVFYGLLDMSDYETINNLLIIRNFLIILTYPLNFAIYFGMSSSFKLQVGIIFL